MRKHLTDPFSHQEFVSQYRRGKVGIRYNISDIFEARTFLASIPENLLMIVTGTVGSPLLLPIAATLMAFLMRDWWTLVSVPLAWAGTFLGGMAWRPGLSSTARLGLAVGIAGLLLFGLWLGPKHGLFVACLCFMIAYFAMSIQYRIASRALTSPAHTPQKALDI